MAIITNTISSEAMNVNFLNIKLMFYSEAIPKIGLFAIKTA